MSSGTPDSVKRYALSLKDGVREYQPHHYYPATTSVPMVAASDYDALKSAFDDRVRVIEMQLADKEALSAKNKALEERLRLMVETLRDLVNNEGAEACGYLDQGIGTKTKAGQRWLRARDLLREEKPK